MNKLRYMILAFAAVLSLAAISCSPKSEYTPGKQDVEDCFGVYFPSQEAGSKTISLEPGDAHRVKITVAREFSDVDYDINVPYELTGDTDIFEVEGDGIVFEGGAATTSFWMDFSNAEVGKKYNCTLEVTDPQYVSNYRTKANYITLNVTIVRWEEIGMATYIDNMFTNTQTKQPLTVQTKVYKNSDDNSIFRVDDPYSEFMTQSGAASSTSAPDYFEFKVLKRGQEFTAFEGAETIMIPVDDLVHYEPIFTSFADPQYGDAYYYHPSLLTGYEDPLTWYDNRVMSWLDAAKTKPGVVQLAPSLYFPNAGGYAPEICINIVFPGAKLTDYSLKVEAGFSENGEVPVSLVLGADVAKVKYAVFSGELDAVRITEKVSGITAGTIQSKTINTAGDYKITDLKETGMYTIVAVGYDSTGEQVSNTATVFGFLKAGDENPVQINCGLIVSDKYAPAGYTAENSAEFYIHGTDIKKAAYGLYRKKDFDEKYESVIEDLKKIEMSENELDAVNGEGLTDVFIRLNSGMEYVLVVYASNGYEETIVHAAAKLAGEINPLQMTYDLDMLTPAESKADYCKEWAFWCGTPDSNGRYPVGPVTITDGGKENMTVENEDRTEEEIEVEILKVKGFWKPVVDEGFLKDDTMKWQYYGGAIVPLHTKVGSFSQGSSSYDLVMLSFFTSSNGGLADGAVCGAFTEEGNVAFVDMETGNYDDYGDYWFTSLGVFDQKGNYISDMIAYDEMLFVAPENVPSETPKSSSTTAMLNEVKMSFQKNYNYVEYKRYQLYKAIDSVFGQQTIKSFGQRAGLDIEMENTQIDCTLEAAEATSGTFRRSEMPGSVSLRK
jgi:hypothetical protein